MQNFNILANFCSCFEPCLVVTTDKNLPLMGPIEPCFQHTILIFGSTLDIKDTQSLIHTS